jgi:4-amino-4-deoxy-L-arabinose transferase-like glycosyltransferase
VRDASRSSAASWAVLVSAFVARASVLVWAGRRFPPAADGVYYHALATRIAAGLGYTWLWPDGKVTYAAHYPVGYPALLAGAYRVFGASYVVGGWLNALLGSIAALAAHRLALRAMSPRWAFVAGGAVALHPALVFYTPAIMTEGVTASLLAIAAWLVASARERGPGPWHVRILLVGLVLGVATLVRPQSLALAPFFGAMAAAPLASWRERGVCSAMALLVALAVCAPWTARNCTRMGRCALVSVNGGWNLAIGADASAHGTWGPIDVPEACRTVWDEAEKDVCFGRETRRKIREQPLPWLGLMPDKLAATFDYSGAPGYYLHASNADAFDDRAKTVLGIVETAYERLSYLGALAAAALVPGLRPRARKAVALLGALLLFQTHAYLAVLLLAVALGLLGKQLVRGPVLLGVSFAVVVATAVVHAVFFGAGRYGMVVFPLSTTLAVAALASAARREAGMDPGAEGPGYAAL